MLRKEVERIEVTLSELLRNQADLKAAKLGPGKLLCYRQEMQEGQV